MTTAAGSHQRDNLAGSLWMVFAMLGFAIEDALLKATAKDLPVGQILVLFGAGGAVVFAVVARARGARLVTPDVASRPMRYRVLFEIVGRLFYTLAIALAPLSSATVILQATPIVVVAGAAILFRERVGWRRWTAIAIGLAGVLLILRPGADSFSLLSILAVLGMLGFAGRDLASRAAPRSLGPDILGLYGFLAVVMAGALFSAWAAEPFRVPEGTSALALLGAILAGTVAYAGLMTAMRTGEVSAVTPFRYSRLLIGVTFGIVFFGERLDVSMLLGSALIVLSGLFILWRGRRAR